MSDVTKLGELLDATAQRDAVHIAVAPVVAAFRLAPGDHIGLEAGSTERATDRTAHPIGIVDPFLKADVEPGERFWMFLYPQTITSLRHRWTHPAFADASASENPSRLWIERFAAELDQTYNRLMAAAEQWVDTDDGKWGGDYTYDNSEAYKRVDDEKWPLFWKHYEIVTGRRPKQMDACPFTCSC